MCTYSQTLISLLVRSVVFSVMGGWLFTILSGTSVGMVPYIACIGLGAGWPLTRPLGMIALGENGVIFTAFFFAVRVGVALIIGWAVLTPYTVYLVIQAFRNGRC